MRISFFRLIPSFFFSFLYFSQFLSAQSKSSFWIPSSKPNQQVGNWERLASKADYYQLELERFKQELNSAPSERAASLSQYGKEIILPVPGGKMVRFHIAAYELMEPKLASRYPKFRTYFGRGIDEPTARVFLDITATGFHARIFFGDELIYIDPASKGNVENYQVYRRQDLPAGNSTNICSAHPDSRIEDLQRGAGNSTPLEVDIALERGFQIRKYRIAVAATKEFTDYYGSKDNAISEIISLVNTANALYEKDLAIRFVLVGNNDALVYTTEPDPYDNANYAQMISANTGVLNNRIGSTNYDVGIVLCSTGGGLASLGVICGASKGAAVANGTDNIWDFHFVHEIGHQFNAGHSWSGAAAGCGVSQFDPMDAVEPGSGITLMSYGGSCGEDNFSTGRYMQFHNHSQRVIQQFITVGLGSTCGTVLPTGNFPPTVVTLSPENVTIPISTPYQLQGAAADLNGDQVQLVWEQVDVANSQRSINQVDLPNGPLTRTYRPSKSGGTRCIPPIENLATNQPSPGDNLGTVSRQMNYRLTGRDMLGGSRDKAYSFSVSSAAGPFVVTQPAGGEWFQKNQAIQVNWNVANTQLPPVNCQKVFIRLSVDGGFTFPYLLANQTPNDGSENVILPNVVSDSCRIQVGAIGNIFFDLNPGNFTIDFCRGTSVCNGGGLDRHFITRVEMGNINQPSSCATLGYSQYIPTKLPIFSPDQVYTLKATLGSLVFNQAMGVWIDYNDDGDFDDLDEFVASAGPSSISVSAQIQLLGAQYAKGSRRMRIRIRPSQVFTAGEACINLPFGETEDYQIRIDGYCFENSLGADPDFGPHFISKVQLGSLSNESAYAPNGYTNFIDSVPVPVLASGTQELVVETSNLGPVGLGVWLDVNNDGDFADAGEFLGNSVPNANYLATLSITIPQIVLFGNEDGQRRLRIRTAYNVLFSASQSCSGGFLGETEDYLIRIASYCIAPIVNNGLAEYSIAGFSLAGISNLNSSFPVSGYSYTRYPETDFLGKMALGVSYSGQLIRGATATSKKVRIWMDLNNDLDFDDQGELLLSQAFIQTATFPFSLTIPYNYQYIGKRRMRVMLVDATDQDVQPCTSGGFLGEVEDYVVEIQEAISLEPFNPNFCQGQTIHVPFSLRAEVPAGTQFDVYLSDEMGDFGNGRLIGSGTSSPVACQIPDSAVYGFGYRIQLKANAIANLEVTSPNSEYHVYPMPAIEAIQPIQAPVGTQIVLLGSFFQVEQVNFQDTPAVPDSISADGKRLYVTVPAGAVSGPVWVFTEFCQTSFNGFQVGTCDTEILLLGKSSASSPDCKDGKIRVQANSGGRFFLYSIPSGQVDSLAANDTLRATFSGLKAGNYRVKFISISGCKDSLDVVIPSLPCQLDAVNMTTTGSNAGNGKLEFDLISGNCAPVTFTLSKRYGATFLVQLQQPVEIGNQHFVFAGLSAGEYQIAIQSGSCNQMKTGLVDSVSLLLSKPDISPGTGTYTQIQQVFITCATPGVSLYYTTSGNIPVLGTGYTRLYTGPFPISQTTTIRAMAVKAGSVNSPVAVAVLTFSAPVQVAAPVFNLPSGSYSGTQVLTMQTATSDASIYYTLNGNTPLLTVPNTFTRLYTGPITLSSGLTVKAIAVKSGLPQSNQTTASYTIQATSPVVAAPIISPGTGTYSGPVTVSLSSSTPGAEIFYTTNGNIPLLSIPNFFTKRYTGPFSVSVSTTIRAVATFPEMSNSGVSVAYLTIAPARFAFEPETSPSRESGWIAFPNPSETGEFTLQPQEGNEEEVQVTAYSYDGRKIMERQFKGASLVQVSLKEFAGSVFLLHVQDSKGTHLLRLMK